METQGIKLCSLISYWKKLYNRNLYNDKVRDVLLPSNNHYIDSNGITTINSRSSKDSSEDDSENSSKDNSGIDYPKELSVNLNEPTFVSPLKTIKASKNPTPNVASSLRISKEL